MPYLVVNMEALAVPFDVLDKALQRCLAGTGESVKMTLCVPSFPDACEGLRIQSLTQPHYGEGTSGVRIVPWQITTQTPPCYRFFERVGQRVLKRGEVGPEQDPLEAAYCLFVRELCRQLSGWLRHPLVCGTLHGDAVVIALPLFRQLMVGWFTATEKPQLTPGFAFPVGPALDALLARSFAVPFTHEIPYSGRIDMLSDTGGYRIVEYGERGGVEQEAVYAALAAARMALLQRVLLF